MALDEAILVGVGLGKSPPTLRLYSWSPACLSLGQAQSYSDVDLARLQSRGWDIVRRVTGGRAILHTDELTYSVITPHTETIIAGTVLESYQRLAQALLWAVRAMEVRVEIQTMQAANQTTPLPICFEVPSSYEITVDGKKLIGSAQARRKEGVLQHGSLPLHGDLTRICQVLRFEREAERAETAKRLLEKATTVESVLGRELSWEEVSQAFRQGFEVQLGVDFVPESVSRDEEERAQQLMAEKYTHPVWTQRV